MAARKILHPIAGAAAVAVDAAVRAAPVEVDVVAAAKPAFVPFALQDTLYFYLLHPIAISFGAQPLQGRFVMV